RVSWQCRHGSAGHGLRQFFEPRRNRHDPAQRQQRRGRGVRHRQQSNHRRGLHGHRRPRLAVLGRGQFFRPRRKMLWGGGVDIASIVRCEPMELPMQTLNNSSRSLIALEPASTLIAVIEMSLSSWLVAGIVPGIERQPLKKLAVDESALLRLLHRWREEAEKAGCRIERIVVAFEAGRDGFWLARWLKARSIEAHVIHAASVAVSREHRRAK